MKHFFRFLIVVLFMVTTSEFTMAQEFTVKVPSTDKYGGLIKPLKAGDSISFQITVKNNIQDTCTISISKSVMGYVESWISIKNNKQTILPGKTIYFDLTIHVPSGTGNYDYSFSLYFKVQDKNYNDHSFYYAQLV